jgi:hypothetical protein
MLILHVEDCDYVRLISSKNSLMEIKEMVSATYFHIFFCLVSTSTYTS